MKFFISIKYKLLILLLSLQVLSLGVYFVLVSGLFKSDKIAYIFDSNASMTQSVALEFQRVMDSTKELVVPQIENFVDTQVDKREFSDTKNIDQIFKVSNITNYLSVWLYNPDNQKYEKVYSKSNLDQTLSSIEDEFNKVDVENYKNKNLTYKKIPNTHYFYSVKRQHTPSGWPIIFVQGYDLKGALTVINSSPLHKILLTDNQGQVLVKSSQQEIQNLEDIQSWANFQDTQKNNVPTGASVYTDPEGKEILSSYYKIQQWDLKVIAMVDYKLAMKAIAILIVRSLLFLTMILSVITAIGIMASRKLTKNLSNLSEATKQIAKGDFKIRVQAEANDEVGHLASSFNTMAAEVERLMQETAEKARMQSELQTARTVQSTLFPKSNAELGCVSVSGYYEPASECGGDWWNYSEVDDKVIIWIADATGHGVGPALLTSAAKSAASVIENMKITSPKEIMSIMNKAVSETSKSQVMMTCFIGVIDKKTGDFKFSNASHEFPGILRKKDDGSYETIWVMQAQGARLGQDANSTYEETSFQLMPTDKIILYTDGVLDLQNKNGKGFGDVKFSKTLNNVVKLEDNKPENMTKNLVEEFNKYRNGAELIDDVTFLVCEFKGAQDSQNLKQEPPTAA